MPRLKLAARWGFVWQRVLKPAVVAICIVSAFQHRSWLLISILIVMLGFAFYELLMKLPRRLP